MHCLCLHVCLKWRGLRSKRILVGPVPKEEKQRIDVSRQLMEEDYLEM